jgi:hypothetical protein
MSLLLMTNAGRNPVGSFSNVAWAVFARSIPYPLRELIDSEVEHGRNFLSFFSGHLRVSPLFRRVGALHGQQ